MIEKSRMQSNNRAGSANSALLLVLVSQQQCQLESRNATRIHQVLKLNLTEQLQQKTTKMTRTRVSGAENLLEKCAADELSTSSILNASSRRHQQRLKLHTVDVAGAVVQHQQQLARLPEAARSWTKKRGPQQQEQQEEEEGRSYLLMT
jgi:hypothetical protein